MLAFGWRLVLFFCLLCAVRSASSPLRSDFCVVKTDGEWSGPHELRYPSIFTASEEQCAGSCPVLNVAATLGIDRAAVAAFIAGVCFLLGGCGFVAVLPSQFGLSLHNIEQV